MSQVQISVDSETLSVLDASAEFRSLSREEMLREAINEAAEYDRYYCKSVDTGLKDAAAGRTISNEQMKAQTAALLQKIRSTSQR